MRASVVWTSAFLLLLTVQSAVAGTGVHTTWLWHMHQPIYWPAESGWTPGRYETAYETITLGHSQNNVFEIFNKDDRVADYQHYPKDALASVLDLPEAGAQVSFAGALIENLNGLGQAGWNGGRYASNWFSHYRTAKGWTNSAGQSRLDPVLVGFHHAIGPLMDDVAFRMELACAREIWGDAWGGGPVSTGFFPAEMCFSERLIPALVDAGVTWSVVPDLHLGRACANYPYAANLDNCDPPNPADQTNASQAQWTQHFISRGVTLKVPYPFGFTPHRAQYVDPTNGQISSLVVVPAANAMGWDEGYGLYGTGDIDQIALANNPSRPMLVLLAHDGDNAWSGGYSYYNENVNQFAHNAAANGYTPTTVATYLAHHPVPQDDVVHVEDGGWVNADGDFGSPQYINWNWPLVGPTGQFDIPGGWAEDQRNWAVLTAAQNRVETAAALVGSVDPAQVTSPSAGANLAERAWHFLLAGYESGYMYYGAALDMEIKATLACNRATDLVDPVVGGGTDLVAPTIWLPQRLPWNPGGYGGGSLWQWPSGQGAPMTSAFHVWTFCHDVSGLERVELMVRVDDDQSNDPATVVNETYAGGSGVGDWTALPMTHRAMPLGEPWEMGDIDFSVLPNHIADQYWLQLSGYSDVLLDYYIEAEDSVGNIKRSPIQHVYVGTGDSGQGGDEPFVMDGSLDDDVDLLATAGTASLWAAVRGQWLYLATDAISLHGGDTFLLMGQTSAGSHVAPWAKAGQVAPWLRYLAREADNGWSGWFDAGESVLDDGAQVQDSGTILEGALDLDQLFPSGWPTEVYLAMAQYGSADGEGVLAQIPGGDGNDSVEADEYFVMTLTGATQVDQPTVPQARLVCWPNPFNAQVNLRLSGVESGMQTLTIYDARGRVTRCLTAQAVAGDVVMSWNGCDDQGRAMPSGVYFVRTTGSIEARTRIVLVK